MPSCIICGATHNDIEVTSFHNFPINENRAALWRQSMGITNHKIRREGCFRRFMICSKHFTKNSYRNKYCNKLNPNAVPTLLPLIPTEKNQNTGNAENCNSNRGETVSEIGKFEFVGVEEFKPEDINELYFFEQIEQTIDVTEGLDLQCSLCSNFVPDLFNITEQSDIHASIIRNLFEYLYPDFTLDSTRNLQICPNCYSTLFKFYNFKNNLLEAGLCSKIIETEPNENNIERTPTVYDHDYFQ